MSARAAVVLVAIVGVLAGSAGCASTKVYREGTATIAGRAGESFIIELPGDPATGYSWSMVGQPDPTIATLITTDFATVPSPTSGTSGHERWTFRLVAPGTTSITFGYGRTFAISPAERAVMFTIVVR